MDYNSDSSSEGKCKRQEDFGKKLDRQQSYVSDPLGGLQSAWNLDKVAKAAPAIATASTQAKISLGVAASKSLSSQVMEYYQK